MFDKIRLGFIADRSQFYKDLAGGPFFGPNRPGAKVSQGMIDSFGFQGMQAGPKHTFGCIKPFSETDLYRRTQEQRRARRRGSPLIEACQECNAEDTRGCVLSRHRIHPQRQLNADLLAFLQA